MRLDYITTPVDWMADAACKDSDPNLFFPVVGCVTKEAKAICARCQVRFECLDFAMKERIDDGLWGGLTEKERKQLRRRAS